MIQVVCEAELLGDLTSNFKVELVSFCSILECDIKWNNNDMSLII